MRQLKNQKEANELRAEILKRENYICPITGYRLTMSNSVLDHDHFTGKVRGVLFNGANRVLQDQQWVRYGLKREDHPAMLRAMADYLECELVDIMHHSRKPPGKIITKRSYKKLGLVILRNGGRLPWWWGYVKLNGKNAQKLSKRLKVLYDKYELEPEFYAS